MLFDTHAHLSGLIINAEEMLGSLFRTGIAGIIDISLRPGDLHSRIKKYSSFTGVRFASGLWPWPASIANREKMLDELEKEILVNMKEKGEERKHSAVCALGEFGLDHHWNGEGKEGSRDLKGERELMEMQMDMAKRLSFPVIIHSREAAKETAEVLRKYPNVSGIVHCFSYGKEEAKTFLDLGYFISFAGNLTFKNAHNLHDACRLIPEDKLLFETDSPYLAPVPYRGKEATPGMVAQVYKKAAELRNTTIQDLALNISENCIMFFG